MNCDQVQELLSQYYDSELPVEERTRVSAHVDLCPVCQKELARFGKISRALQRPKITVPPELTWQAFESQLSGHATLAAIQDQGAATDRRFRSNWFRQRGRRSAMVAAAIVLVAVGWFAAVSWLGHGSRHLLAADIQQYVTHFERDPEAAQQLLMAKYEGQTIGLDEAVRHVSYQPLAAHELPDSFAVDAMYVLKMPCCDCLQTVCQRRDGSRIAIFEYGEEDPDTEQRAGGMAPCRGANCCLVEAHDYFAKTWKKGDHFVSVVGIRDAQELDVMRAWLK